MHPNIKLILSLFLGLIFFGTNPYVDATFEFSWNQNPVVTKQNPTTLVLSGSADNCWEDFAVRDATVWCGDQEIVEVIIEPINFLYGGTIDFKDFIQMTGTDCGVNVRIGDCDEAESPAFFSIISREPVRG